MVILIGVVGAAVVGVAVAVIVLVVGHGAAFAGPREP